MHVIRQLCVHGTLTSKSLSSHENGARWGGVVR